GRLRTESEFRKAVEREVIAILTAGPGGDGTTPDGGPRGAKAPPVAGTRIGPAGLNIAGTGLTVYLIVGVNGVGKTTTIGKLAHRLKREGHRPLLAAADTFRAGAIDQLRIWAERVGAEFVGGAPGADPAAVAFDALDAAESR